MQKEFGINNKLFIFFTDTNNRYLYEKRDTMKINHIGPSGINPYKRNQMNQQPKSVSSFKEDKVEISTEAKGLQEMNQIQTAREEKVNKLKIAVENGTYKVDPNVVANKMIDFYYKK